MRDQPVIVRDFSPQAPDMDCVMGAALLRARVIEFDYAAARVQLYASAGFTSPPGATAVPLIFRSDPAVPFVLVHIDLPDGSGLRPPLFRTRRPPVDRYTSLRRVRNACR